jgi:RHS repeat-associated protein
MVDGFGTVVRKVEYDPYGVVLSDTSPGLVPFGFAGGLADGDTGLVRFGARDYDPRLGRWTSKDPLRFAGGDTGLYAYSGADPVNYVDLTGHAPQAAIWVLVAYGTYSAVGALYRAPQASDWMGVKGGGSPSGPGPDDAMRHCTAACTTGFFGLGVVPSFLALDVFWEGLKGGAYLTKQTPQQKNDAEMDFCNNHTGWALAVTEPLTPCEKACKGALDRGELWVNAHWYRGPNANPAGAGPRGPQ